MNQSLQSASLGRATRVAIVGAGLGGLAAAVELARSGIAVTLIDQNRHLGGKMNLLEDRGYSFDMGPTILTLPQVIRGIIRRAGRRVEDYIDIVDLDPQWRCFFEDGVTLDLRSNAAAMSEQLDRQFPGQGAGDGWRSFLGFARRMFRLSEKVFFYKDIGGVRDMMRASPLFDPKLLGDVLAMRMHATMAGTVHRHITEPHVRQMSEHFLQYVGSSPFLAPAILSLIAAAQSDHGCCYAMSPDGSTGGTRSVARALGRLCEEFGVEVILGERVARIVHEGGMARGVELASGRRIDADAVVSNCDVQRTCTELVGGPAAESRRKDIARAYTPACSGLVLYLGLDRRYEHLAHHNFLFSRDSHAEFEDIYERGVPARDPTLYLAVPSRTDPTQAPAGGEALYVLIHTPYLRAGHRWEESPGVAGPTLREYRPVVLDKLKRFGMPDLEQRIVVDRFLTPQGIERMYNAEGGAIYGLASHGRLAGGFKPRNRSKELRNLYLAGGSVNPGPGMPMVMMSGVTAAWSLLEDLGRDVPREQWAIAGDEKSRQRWGGPFAATRAEEAALAGAT